jgi:hypothetical protein
MQAIAYFPPNSFGQSFQLGFGVFFDFNFVSHRRSCFRDRRLFLSVKPGNYIADFSGGVEADFVVNRQR